MYNDGFPREMTFSYILIIEVRPGPQSGPFRDAAGLIFLFFLHRTRSVFSDSVSWYQSLENSVHNCSESKSTLSIREPYSVPKA